MDNLTHTLAGAALGLAGLKRRTGLAMPALMIGANLPDVDVLCTLFADGLVCRRGWTHGPVGWLILPAALMLALICFDQWQTRRGSRPGKRPAVRPAQLLMLCYIGALSHPLLDLMNNWGIRLLMPFSERWFYGDVLFIVDPWIWLLLGMGIWLSRRRERNGAVKASQPALLALLIATCYSVAMAAGGRLAEQRVARQFEDSGLGKPVQVLASPVFADPFRRRIVVQTAHQYGFGDFYWLPQPRVSLEQPLVASGMANPIVAQAAQQSRKVANFLYWSRFPFAAVHHDDKGSTVTVSDARYAKRPEPGMFAVSFTVPANKPEQLGQVLDQAANTGE